MKTLRHFDFRPRDRFVRSPMSSSKIGMPRYSALTTSTYAAWTLCSLYTHTLCMNSLTMKPPFSTLNWLSAGRSAACACVHHGKFQNRLVFEILPAHGNLCRGQCTSPKEIWGCGLRAFPTPIQSFKTHRSPMP